MMKKTDINKPISYSNVLIKALILFLIINILIAFFNPLPALGKVSAYNFIFPGRVRLPFGEKSELAYNLSMFNLNAMFASHNLTDGPKDEGEYRVVFIGDSSVWGFLLEPEETLTGAINNMELTTPDGKLIHAYNIGYPTMSLTKDLAMLSHAMSYDPDLIIWLVTLESFPTDKQLESPILQHNPDVVRHLIETYDLNLDPNDPLLIDKNTLERTIIGERRNFADLWRLQLYGVMWAATGIDQFYPEHYDPPQEDLSPEQTFHDLEPPTLHPEDLALDVLAAGKKLTGDVPILIVNEPMYISQGENSHIRYNFFYPRWAYDQYREEMFELTQQNNWHFLDVWDIVLPEEFTNSAIHMTPNGTQILANRISEAILSLSQD
jgi:hypothetical protein